MKIIKFSAPLTGLLFALGCQSHQPSVANNSTANNPASEPIYRIDSIPKTRLSPTSRDGDNPTQVYSDNIIAVYRVDSNNVIVDKTNAPFLSPKAKGE